MTLSYRIKIAFLALVGAALVTVGPAWIGYQVARGDTEAPLVVSDVQLQPDDAPGTHAIAVATASGDTYTIYSATGAFTDDGEPIVIAQADTGSAGPAAPAAPSPELATPAANEATGSGSASVPPIGSPLDELAAVKAKYEALKAAKGSGSKDLLWFAYAALAAAFIRVLLAGIHAWRGDKPKGWAKWAALGLAVPLALLTYYAAGAGLWAAIVMAGAGPGAIIVNELLKRKTAPAS